MGLILLRLGEIEEIGERRTTFSASQPWAPRRRVALDNARIYAIYRADGLYVVYETDKIDFYRHYIAPGLPRNAVLVEKLVYKKPRCPRCGSYNVGIDAEEMYCLDCGYSGFWVYEKETVYEARPVPWDRVLTGQPPEKPTVVTEENADYFLVKTLEELGYRLSRAYVRRGYVTIAGEVTATVVKPDHEFSTSNTKLKVGIGYLYESHWDDTPRTGEPGVYAVLEVEAGDALRVFYVKLRDLTKSDVEGLDAETRAKLFYAAPEEMKLIAGEELARKTVDELVGKKQYSWAAELAERLGLNAEKLKAEAERQSIREELAEVVAFVKGERDQVSLWELKKDPVLAREVAREMGLDYDELIKKYEERKIEVRRERERRRAEEAKALASDLLGKLPDWAEGFVVVPETCWCGEDADIDYTVYPVKRDKRGFYFKKQWRPIDSDYRYRILSERLVTRDGEVHAVEINRRGEYMEISIEEARAAEA